MNRKITSGRSKRILLPSHAMGIGDEYTEKSFISWCEREKADGKLLAVDLFSGAGGFGVGVEESGWTVAVAVDNDERALETHRANFRGLAQPVDMFDDAQIDNLVTLLKKIGVDLVMGGPPCQPFSLAAKTRIAENDKRKTLWQSFIKVVLAIKPRAVLMENVPQIATENNFSIVREILTILEEEGYFVDYQIMDASFYGVPQKRKRFILQARLDGIYPSWPKVVTKNPLTVRDAIHDLPRLKSSIGDREMKYANSKLSELASNLRSTNKSNILYDHMTRPTREDDLEIYKIMDSKTKYSEIPEPLKRYRSDIFNDKYKRLDWDKPCRTITAHLAKDGYGYIHPEEHRSISVREAARIQTFPDSFRFSGTRSDAFRQVGNAVPPILGKHISKNMHPDSNVNYIYKNMLKNSRDAILSISIEYGFHNPWLSPFTRLNKGTAIIVALLRIYEMDLDIAEKIMSEYRRVKELKISHLKKLVLNKWLRKKNIILLREIINDCDENNFSNTSSLNQYIVKKYLRTEYQLNIYSNLIGETHIFVKDNIKKNINSLNKIFGCDTFFSNLNEDLESFGGYKISDLEYKLIVSKMVGFSNDSSLIMCGLAYIPNDIFTEKLLVRIMDKSSIKIKTRNNDEENILESTA